jgi:1-deoxy-D-xylulose-5-phosphate synthase
MVLASPKDENELAAMVRTAVEYGDGPIAVRYPRGAGLGVRMDYEPGTVPIGKAERLRVGDDVSLIAIGSMVGPALAAAEELSRGGLSASVVNARWVKPIDRDAIVEEAMRTGRIVTIEENVRAGGFGAAVMELLERERMDGVVVRIMALPDEYVTHGTREVLLDRAGLGLSDIVARAREAASRRPSFSREVPR